MSNKIRIKLRSFDSGLVDKSARSIANIAKSFGLDISGPLPLPRKIDKHTVLRSTYVNKKSREQFEIRTHKRLIDIYKPTNEVVNSLTKIDIPAGVDVQILY